LIRTFETGRDEERCSVALALQQAHPDHIDAAFEQRDLRNQVRDIQLRLVAEKIDWKALA
jgi:hypothetical protein